MAKIIGNTTATPNPKPDWAQTDETKADYIKNKPTLLTEENVIELIGEHGSAPQVQSDWNQIDETQPDYIKNKPSTLSALPEVSEEDDGKIVEVEDGAYVLKDIASSSIGTYVQTVVDGALDEIDTLIGGEDADEGTEGG